MYETKRINSFYELMGNSSEYREAVQRERLKQVAERKKSIAALSSPEHDAERRIRLWEHLHGMHLPREPDHELVRVIAGRTALTVAQVNAEQRRRAAATSDATSAESSV
jgi:hypothetical protein